MYAFNKRNNANKKCPNCNGTGVNPLMVDLIDILSGDWADHRCPKCNGKGLIEANKSS